MPYESSSVCRAGFFEADPQIHLSLTGARKKTAAFVCILHAERLPFVVYGFVGDIPKRCRTERTERQCYSFAEHQLFYSCDFVALNFECLVGKCDKRCVVFGGVGVKFVNMRIGECFQKCGYFT